MALPGARRDSDTLQQLRRLLPCEVRVTSPVHPLFGRLLQASTFKRWSGDLLLVVILPDGSPGTIPVSATDLLGPPEAALDPSTVMSVEGVRGLRRLLGTLADVSGRSRKGAKTRK